jgi:hypothetical protein
MKKPIKITLLYLGPFRVPDTNDYRLTKLVGAVTISSSKIAINYSTEKKFRVGDLLTETEASFFTEDDDLYEVTTLPLLVRQKGKHDR